MISACPTEYFDYDHQRARNSLLRAQTSTKVAALTILSYASDPPSELSLQQHLNIAPDLLANYDRIAANGGDDDESMMAQEVPHPTQQPDRRRVKVYELRDNDWFDRGTGFCSAEFIEVRLSCVAMTLSARGCWVLPVAALLPTCCPMNEANLLACPID